MLTHIDRARMEKQLDKLKKERDSINNKIEDIQRVLSKDWTQRRKAEKK